MDLLRSVRDEVRMAIHEGIDEYGALSFLARAIMDKLVTDNIKHVVEYFQHPDDPNDVFPVGVTLSEVKDIISHPNFGGTDVAAMVSACPNANVSMRYRSLKLHTKGEYESKRIDGHVFVSSIHLYYSNRTLNELKPIYHGDPKILLNFLWSQIGTYLIHELKHAVDDFRLGSHFNKHGGSSEFKEKYRINRPSPPDFLDEDPKEWLEYHHTYLNLPHEVWARFAQLMDSIEFKQEDLETPYATMADGSPGKLYIMNSMADVISKLNSMRGWSIMNDKQKRRLINVLSGFWHEVDEQVKENNEQVNAARTNSA